MFWLAILKLKSDEEDPKVCRADLIEALNLSPEMADRVGQLVLQEDWMFGGGSGVAGDDWVRAVNEHTRAVATVTSVDDYLALEGQRFWSKPAAMLPSEHAKTGISGIPVGALMSTLVLRRDKYTSMRTCLQSRISGPWSHGQRATSYSGSVWIFAAIAGMACSGL